MDTAITNVEVGVTCGHWSQCQCWRAAQIMLACCQCQCWRDAKINVGALPTPMLAWCQDQCWRATRPKPTVHSNIIPDATIITKLDYHRLILLHGLCTWTSWWNTLMWGQLHQHRSWQLGVRSPAANIKVGDTTASKTEYLVILSDRIRCQYGDHIVWPYTYS